MLQIEMAPITSGTQSNLNAKIPKDLEEMGLNSRAYEKYMNKKYRHIPSMWYNLLLV